MGAFTFKHSFFGSFVECSGVLQTVFIFLLIPCCLADKRAPPLIPNVPLLWVWNAPTEFCIGGTNQPLDMSFFSIVGTPRKNITGQSITLYYVDRLGYYPYIDPHTGAIVHGGLPQLMNLQQHLRKSRQDILFYMPTDSVGLAVIDWEEWRPTWTRNWRPKDIYRNKSIELVKSQHPQYNHSYAVAVAKRDFERTGKAFMLETLKLGKSLRPSSLWGYYLFPDCYNTHFTKPNYDGHCPPIELQRNNDLQWLWNDSTALYPSVYLTSRVRSSQNGALYVRNRVHESIRVSKLMDDKNPLPIYVYIRLVFTDQTTTFLELDDLVHSVGEIVPLGVSGIIIWGSLSLTRSLVSCIGLENYMKGTLLPYLINVTLAAKMCGQVLCKNQGICTRKDWNTNTYLHLNATNFDIELQQNGKFVVHGKPSLEDLQEFSKNFHCSCYTNVACKDRLDVHNVRSVNVCTANNICIDAVLNFPSLDDDDEPPITDDTSQNQDSISDITSSAPPSSHILPKDLSWCLFLLSIFSQHWKYLL
ncbi:hyaluronidase PH-20 precursor [Cavia porcellus]|uniref:Hyaluronidase PH-20 n=1 Tax=Cavia porcellus TaxID=10141 RepID=HYALP_CAVPO|nr:hyaluronidase PH-20 precursor [Cavia porcellus]P23613.1 RecName: Full=Hyaluronidase PH-20; Short=Hyal-PH20; AltName: Full=Hyaluronoglucosaminidase PH-20; AltName: Full=Sperm adhesion molecule 1; AltName: Full=Sperm surface protein PH-20; Flags: Precursor [Cavia porcellus]CAA39768.1 sperm protein PH-20 [Cavia porcellus]prf//1704257A sperm surface protein PH20 [Cavia porcellus]